MNRKIIALHGFLGQAADWNAVRAASAADLDWSCPELFGHGDSSFDPPAPNEPCWLAGYSFGARLALRWLQAAPESWLGALLVSADPGNFQDDGQRARRRAEDGAWADAFRVEPWKELTGRWNARDVFRGDPVPVREEKDFDRMKLAFALEKFSTADQFTDVLRLPSRLVWLAGSRDAKFRGLQDRMRAAGFPGSFSVVEDAGHRLLQDAPDAVAAALDHLVA